MELSAWQHGMGHTHAQHRMRTDTRLTHGDAEGREERDGLAHRDCPHPAPLTLRAQTAQPGTARHILARGTWAGPGRVGAAGCEVDRALQPFPSRPHTATSQ